MNNNYTIAERNNIVEEHLWCINAVIKQNRLLIRATRLEYDDVYQQLAERLIRAVNRYNPDKGALVPHICHNLHYELLTMASPEKLTGIKDAPRSFRVGDKASLDRIEASGVLFPEQAAA